MTIGKELPTYEVEFIPLERRLIERREPLHEMNVWLPLGEPRSLPGRRNEDWKACYSAI